MSPPPVLAPLLLQAKRAMWLPGRSQSRNPELPSHGTVTPSHIKRAVRGNGLPTLRTSGPGEGSQGELSSFLLGPEGAVPCVYARDCSGASCRAYRDHGHQEVLDMTVELTPIMDPDMAVVGDFLHANLNTRVPASAWMSALSVPWKVNAPNHGFMLLEEQRVVGAYLAFYSERVIAGQLERFCNLGAWCVLPDFRFHSVRLLKALLGQDGYHFTDLSPSGSVVPLNIRFRFRSLDTSTALVPNLPWPILHRRTRISADPKVIETTLAGAELELYRDHAGAAAVHHLILVRGGDSCYVMFRKVRRKDLPLFAAILYVGNPELFRRALCPLTRHLLAHYRVLATLAELRIVKYRPRPAVMLRSPRPKMYRSVTLEPTQIDDLYSELVCVPW
jgi:hypothetical protein